MIFYKKKVQDFLNETDSMIKVLISFALCHSENYLLLHVTGNKNKESSFFEGGMFKISWSAKHVWLTLLGLQGLHVNCPLWIIAQAQTSTAYEGFPMCCGHLRGKRFKWWDVLNS